MEAHEEHDRMLTAAQVAKLWGVDSKTVTRWSNRGKLPFIRTPGGHRRFPESYIRALIAASTQETW